MKKCNICDGLSFELGPNGRRSKNGGHPRCAHCQSLERHRAFRALALTLSSSFDFSKMSCLQFSQDLAFEANWFSSRLLSIYNGINSIDLQNISHPDESFDFIICNHVIEHVADDFSALNELIRILKSSGILFLSFPDPLGRAITVDWGFPDDKMHGHYRVYGADAVNRFGDILSKFFYARCLANDPVTNVDEEVWLITKSENIYRMILDSGINFA
jgi:SAM-dependent methyltransferase